MSKSTISTFELFAMFPDQETARVYLEGRLWPNGVRCPVCGTGDRITTRKGGYYRCNQCAEDFTVRTGTIFERSHVPLHKWIYAMYLLVTARKGISSMQLAKEIGITQKSAWFVLQRLREACGDKLDVLRGIVEVDEMYVGGKDSNRHAIKRKGVRTKTAVVGMREKNGKVVAMPVPDTGMHTLSAVIHNTVEMGATLHTDEYGSYALLGNDYEHQMVNHSKGQYAHNGVSTNSIESVWAVMKRGLHGVYHHVSEQHLHRYVDEFAFRLNEGNCQRHTLDRLESFVVNVAGKRLTYKALIQ
ncbi:MAG: IS1595 family transposase [Stellaceae bacterium]